MIWTDNSNETNKYEAERTSELSIPMQELWSGINRIRSARTNVEISISDVVARLAAKEYNENLERVRAAAQTQPTTAKAVEASHVYPLVPNSEATAAPAAPQQPEVDLLHEDELDPNAIRAMLNDIRDSLEEDK